MKVKQIKKDGNSIVLEATASAQDVARALQTAAEAFAMAMGLQPEPNKTVDQAISEKLGIRDIDKVVGQGAIDSLIPLALDKRNIIPAYPPKANADQEITRGKDFKFTLDVELRPEYELASYEPVDVEVHKFEIDETLIQAELNSMTNQYTTYVKDESVSPDYALKKGDFAKIAIEAIGPDGKPYKNLNTTGRTYAIGQGHMPDAFDSQIQGMKTGDEKSFSFAAPSFDENFNETEEEVECTVKVIEVLKEQAPELDDEWVQKNMPWFKSADELKQSIRKTIEMGQREGYDAYVRQVVAAAWAGRFEGKIADEIYENMTRQLADNLRLDLQQQGKTWDQFVEENGGESQLNMMLMLQAREVLTQGFALDAIFRHFKLVVTDADIEAVCHAMNPQADPKQLRQQIEEHGQGFALRESAERYKANIYAVENANITYVS